MYTTKGKVKEIMETVKVTDSFSKREIVLITEEKYPQTPVFQFVQDGCDKLNEFKVGEEVEINWNLNGREWKNTKTGEVKYFNSLNGWKINKLGAVSNKETIVNQSNQQDDDLPF